MQSGAVNIFAAQGAHLLPRSEPTPRPLRFHRFVCRCLAGVDYSKQPNSYFREKVVALNATGEGQIFMSESIIK